MKKILVPIFTLVLIVTSFAAGHAEQPGLDYKKFGRIATAVVIEDYPGQKVVEYKYEGREKLAENKVLDSFRFQVMVNGKGQFVTVKITHDNSAGKELTITLEEEK
ncbi:DUF3889 domain-containing protein [Robertmurraya korlensis]|uniref:DUF3889 domain-containing protein n=1 Tax=Robertmurraya korlensis TaxID=519977 RepID=UPI0008246EF2|nr:DUF3889 domain-containing protein [Robertmurraya korlensis]